MLGMIELKKSKSPLIFDGEISFSIVLFSTSGSSFESFRDKLMEAFFDAIFKVLSSSSLDIFLPRFLFLYVVVDTKSSSSEELEIFFIIPSRLIFLSNVVCGMQSGGETMNEEEVSLNN